MPYGWEKRFVRRPNGKNKGRVDVYLRPPNGNQLRSKVELVEYISKHPEVLHDATVTNFNKHDVPEVDDGAASDLSGDDNPDLIEELPEHSPSPPRGRMPARSISRSVPNTSSTDAYEESTF